MIVKAALVGLLYWISMGRAQYFFSFAFRKPVVLGVFIGLVFGDVQAGLLYGATIQLMYMAGIEAGGNIPSDQGLATCIAIPGSYRRRHGRQRSSSTCSTVWSTGCPDHNVRRTINTFFCTRADACIEKKEYDKLSKILFCTSVAY